MMTRVLQFDPLTPLPPMTTAQYHTLSELVDAFNAMIETGQLTPSQALATVEYLAGMLKRAERGE